MDQLVADPETNATEIPAEESEKKVRKKKSAEKPANVAEPIEAITAAKVDETVPELKPSGNRKDLKDLFERLYNLDLSGAVEQKGSLNYLSWARAWAELCKCLGEDDEVSYRIIFNEDGMPYTYDPATGYYVFTEVTINGVTHLMWLPVMDGSNRAMKAEPYEAHYTAYGKDKTVTVQAATATDINKAIMRCLVKNLAMFGLGLRVYNNEDLPETEDEPKAAQAGRPAQPSAQTSKPAGAPAAKQQATLAQTPAQTPAQAPAPAPKKTAESPIDPKLPVKDIGDMAQAYVTGLLREMEEKGISLQQVCARPSWSYCGGKLENLRFEDYLKLKDTVAKSAPKKPAEGQVATN